MCEIPEKEQSCFWKKGRTSSYILYICGTIRKQLSGRNLICYEEKNDEQRGRYTSGWRP